jgi:HSP20 family protein
MGVLPALAETAFVPKFEVKESPDAYIFKADMPGVKESDLEIAVTGNRVTISGRREEEERREDETLYAYERAYGGFSRTFTLPEGADIDNIRAELRDGVLHLAIPKKPEVQPKKVPLQSGGKPTEQKAKA